jgi:hypothetical protein
MVVSQSLNGAMSMVVVTSNLKIFRTSYIFCVLFLLLLSGCRQETSTPAFQVGIR